MYKTINLYHRLKPHYLNILQSQNLNHPDLLGRVMDVLETQSFVCELIYKDVIALNFLLGGNNAFEYFKDI